MSSILKALRRLEAERARKSHVAPEISASLLRDGARRRQSSLWIWPTVITIVTLTVALLTWSLRPAPMTIDSASQKLAPAPFPANLSIDSSAGRGEVIIEEVMDQRLPVLLPPAQPTVSAAALLPARVNPAAERAEAGIVTPVAPIKPTATLIEERQSPVVSAIAWQEESSARMAVVDGLPVMTGETIGTAKIQEIQRDRILFVAEGILFIVRLYPQ